MSALTIRSASSPTREKPVDSVPDMLIIAPGSGFLVSFMASTSPNNWITGAIQKTMRHECGAPRIMLDVNVDDRSRFRTLGQLQNRIKLFGQTFHFTPMSEAFSLAFSPPKGGGLN